MIQLPDIDKFWQATCGKAGMALISALLFPAVAAETPAPMLATKYQQGLDVSRYWVSEKLDGVRARWDGAKLVSRNGNPFAAPAWFIKDFPNIALDGELWSERGAYEQISSITSRKVPHDAWRQIKFMVFDLPSHTGTFSRRVQAMRALLEQSPAPYLGMIKQFRVNGEAELNRRFKQLTANGAEGLMLHHEDALYHSGRSDHLLKYKPFADAEATVIGYRPGQGRFSGMMGSLKVRTDEGVEFHVGSGLSLQQRKNPPPVSARITFRYQGYTQNGLPRFPVFLRVRREID